MQTVGFFVTHDQEEAISISDHVVVMQQGKAIQIGTPIQIYENPVNTFVADFIGKTNIIRCEITHIENGKPVMKLSDKVSISLCKNFLEYRGTEVACSIRPDRIQVTESPCEHSENQFPVKILSRIYMGPVSSYMVSVFDEMNLMVVKQNTRDGHVIDEGETFYIQLNPEDLVLVHER